MCVCFLFDSYILRFINLQLWRNIILKSLTISSINASNLHFENLLKDMTRRTEKKLMQYTNIENVPSVEHLVSASMVSAVDKRNTNRRINVKNKREQKSIRYETLLALTFTLINSLTPFPGRTVTCLKLGDIRSRILFQTKHLKYSKNKKQ